MNNKKSTFVTKSFESILVIAYILFEEIFWNFIAEPVYEAIKGLIALEPLKKTFLIMNRYTLLAIFMLILAISEVMGLVSFAYFIEGSLMLAVFIYLLKIPLVIFTFWLFELTKARLLSFQWLNIVYQRCMRFIKWLQSSDVHIYIKARSKVIRLKANLIIQQYLGKRGLLSSIKTHYHVFKPYLMHLFKW